MRRSHAHHRRFRFRPAALAAALALALGLPPLAGVAPAFAQGSFQQLVTPPAQTQTAPAATTTAPAPTNSSSNGGLSTGASLAIFAGALVLIGAIAFVIMRDARRAAHLKARDVALAGDRPGAGRADRLRRQRARAKQARRARKRNR